MKLRILYNIFPPYQQQGAGQAGNSTRPALAPARLLAIANAIYLLSPDSHSDIIVETVKIQQHKMQIYT